MTFGRRSSGGATPTGRSSEIVGSRWKAALYLTASLAFAAGGLLMLNDPDESKAAAVLCVVLFGLGALIFLLMLVRPQRLALDGQGFTLSGGLVRSPKLVRWRDVEPFFAYRLPRAGKMIGYNFRTGVRPDTTMNRIARRFGADAALPKGWPMSPDAMVEHLNAYRAQALGERMPPRV
jgi:hypothetical protein